MRVFVVHKDAAASADGLVDGCNGQKGQWREIHIGQEYPEDPADSTISGYVLHMLDNGTPRWVKPATMKNYEITQLRRRRMAERLRRE